MRDALHLSYAAVRARAPAATGIVLLHIGEEGVSVAAGTGNEPSQVLTLNMGWSRIVTDFFQHNPPAPIEIEEAIMVVEDEVTRARELAARHPSLYSTDEVIHDIASTAGCPHEPTILLTMEQVEWLFDQLAARSEGRLSSQVQVPDDPRFAATLLILREFMHHLRFDSVTLMREAAATGPAHSM